MDDASFTDSFKDDAYDHGLNYALNQIDDNLRRCYRRYLEDYRVHPISLDGVSFDRAHKTALSSLIHLEYRDQYLGLAA